MNAPANLSHGAYALTGNAFSPQRLRPYAVQVLTLTSPVGPISEIVSFSDPALFARFGLPAQL